MSERIIKIILAVLLFICLAKIPYGYYELVRFFALIGCIYLSSRSYAKGRNVWSYIFICLAILFQPLLKIDLGRNIWNIVDVIVGAALLVTCFFNPANN